MRIETTNLGRWAWVMALCAGCALACGDADNDDKPTETAGSGGKGGASSSGGKGGIGGNSGSGDAGSGADGGLAGMGGGEGDPQLVAWCGPYPLAALCDKASQPCPEDLDALLAREQCSDGAGTPAGATKVTRFETTCGGTLVVAENENFVYQWEFDEDGKLLSVLNGSDAIVECDGTGGWSANTLYGVEPCQRTDAVGDVVCTRGENQGLGGAGGGAGANGD